MNLSPLKKALFLSCLTFNFNGLIAGDTSSDENDTSGYHSASDKREIVTSGPQKNTLARVCGDSQSIIPGGSGPTSVASRGIVKAAIQKVGEEHTDIINSVAVTSYDNGVRDGAAGLLSVQNQDLVEQVKRVNTLDGKVSEISQRIESHDDNIKGISAFAGTVKEGVDTNKKRLDKLEQVWMRIGKIEGSIESINSRLNRAEDKNAWRVVARQLRDMTSHVPLGYKGGYDELSKDETYRLLGKLIVLYLLTHNGIDFIIKIIPTSFLKNTIEPWSKPLKYWLEVAELVIIFNLGVRSVPSQKTMVKYLDNDHVKKYVDFGKLGGYMGINLFGNNADDNV